MFLNFSTNKIMIKEQLAEIYLQSLGVEEMIKFVCSLTDEEIENFVLWNKMRIVCGWMLKGI